MISLPRNDDSAHEPAHLRDYWQVLRRRRGLAFAVFMLVLAAGAARFIFVHRVYQATVQILIERPLPNVLGFERDGRANEVWDDFYQTQYRLLQSRLLARKVIERLDLLQDPEFAGPRAPADVQAAEASAAGTSPSMEQAIDTFLARLRVDPVKNSQLVAVSFRASRPPLAAQVANALGEAYIQQMLEFRYRVSSEAGAWLGTETKEQTRKVEAAELALQKFVEQEGLGNVEERRTLLEQKLKDLGSALTLAKTRRLDKEALYRQMQSTGNPEELPGVISSPLIQSLRTELASLERQHTQLLAKGYLEEYADVVKVRQQIEGTQQRIAHEARRIVRGAENDYQAGAAQERSLAGALEAATAEAQALARKSLKYDALKGDLEASKKLSESILTRQKQTDVSRDVPATNVHIIDAAVVPSVPVRPRPVSDAVLCVVLGLGCALAAAFFRDYLDGSVSRPSDVRRLGLPLLGVIAESRAGRTPPLLVDGGRREAFAEGYRVLRSALDPPEDAKHGQVLLVTSTLPGEGKSLTAVNLALTLASTGERVLLIEADLRRPTLDTLLKTPRTPGLAEVLSRRARLEDAVQPVRSSSLSLLPSGRPAERHAADMLASGALRDLLAGLRGLYDRIVLDTPPAGAVADALALAPIADGVLVVAHCGKVTVNELFHVLERLAQARARILGVVLNRARPDLHRYDYGPSFGLATLGGNGRSLTPVSEIEFDDSTRRVN